MFARNWGKYDVKYRQLMKHYGSATSILSGEILLDRERYGEGERVRKREACAGDRERERDGLLDTNRSLILAEPDFERVLEVREERDSDRPRETERSNPALLEPFLTFLSSPSSSLPDLLPAIASNKTLVLGARPSVSSRTARFIRRGRIMSHTRSSVNN